MLVEVNPTVAFNSEEISSVEFVMDDRPWQWLQMLAPLTGGDEYQRRAEELANAPKRYATKYILRSGKEYVTEYKSEEDAMVEWKWAKALVNSQ